MNMTMQICHQKLLFLGFYECQVYVSKDSTQFYILSQVSGVGQYFFSHSRAFSLENIICEDIGICKSDIYTSMRLLISVWKEIILVLAYLLI